MRAFSCVECEVVHLGLPEQAREPFFGLHGFGALGPLAVARHRNPPCRLHDESDDTVANLMNSETTEKFYREDSACAAQ